MLCLHTAIGLCVVPLVSLLWVPLPLSLSPHQPCGECHDAAKHSDGGHNQHHQSRVGRRDADVLMGLWIDNHTRGRWRRAAVHRGIIFGRLLQLHGVDGDVGRVNDIHSIDSGIHNIHWGCPPHPLLLGMHDWHACAAVPCLFVIPCMLLGAKTGRNCPPHCKVRILGYDAAAGTHTRKRREPAKVRRLLCTFKHWMVKEPAATAVVAHDRYYCVGYPRREVKRLGSVTTGQHIHFVWCFVLLITLWYILAITHYLHDGFCLFHGDCSVSVW